jgi:phosphotransferase system HPr (HPr) family protein
VRSIEVEVRNESGLHARPAAAFVRTAAGFDSTIRLENMTLGRPAADAKSIVGVLTAGVERATSSGSWPTARTKPGRRRPAGLSRRGRVGEPVGEKHARPPIAGTSGAPGDRRRTGLAVPAAGPRRVPVVAVSSRGEAELGSAGRRRRGAARGARGRLCDLGRPGDAEILEAQALMAVDPAIVDEAVRLVRGGHGSGRGGAGRGRGLGRKLAALDDALLAARAGDVRDVASRGPGLSGAQLDLPPARRSSSPRICRRRCWRRCRRACCSEWLWRVARHGPRRDPGPEPGHAGGRGGVSGCSKRCAARRRSPSTARAARSAVDPTTAEFQELADRQAVRGVRATEPPRRCEGRPAATADGRRIRLLANIRSPEDAARALEAGAEGVGLFRTEYLFMRRQSAPSEAEQVGEYRRAMEAFGPDRPVVIRLADIGGDKSIPYLGRPDEPNPFLGVRAIRLADDSRELLLTQLRAIWRAAGLAGVTPHVMAAMVATLADARLLGSCATKPGRPWWPPAPCARSGWSRAS